MRDFYFAQKIEESRFRDFKTARCVPALSLCDDMTIHANSV